MLQKNYRTILENIENKKELSAVARKEIKDYVNDEIVTYYSSMLMDIITQINTENTPFAVGVMAGVLDNMMELLDENNGELSICKEYGEMAKKGIRIERNNNM